MIKTTAESVGVRPMSILLVEDNPGDVMLVEEALKELDQTVALKVVGNGDKALAHLRRQGGGGKAPKPDLVILDLNLPIKNGLEVLREIKMDDEFKDIPVVVFTTSRSHRDILRTYGWGGTFFLTKPLGFFEYMESVKSMIIGARALKGE